MTIYKKVCMLASERSLTNTRISKRDLCLDQHQGTADLACVLLTLRSAAAARSS